MDSATSSSADTVFGVFPLFSTIRQGAPEPQHLYITWVINISSHVVTESWESHCFFHIWASLLPFLWVPRQVPTHQWSLPCPTFPKGQTPSPKAPLSYPALFISIVPPLLELILHVPPLPLSSPTPMEMPHGVILFIPVSPEPRLVPGT